ncbi:MAG: OmpL47-type beta-barrel domain-containing protein [Actinomycetales bacterium]
MKKTPIRPRRVLATIASASLVLTTILLGLGVLSASANTVLSVTVTGGPGTYTDPTYGVYARSGQSATFTANTDSTTACVVVTTGSTTLASLTVTSLKATYQLTAGAGNGMQALTFTPFRNMNNGNCSGAGQVSAKTATYVLDNTGPTLTPGLDPAANPAGWNRTNTTVTWTATDPSADTSTPGSGVPTQPTASTTYTQSGIVALTAPSGVVDRVGNVGTGSGTLRLDKAAPTITGSRTPAPNGFGWNNTPVTTSFACSDNPAVDASGLASPGCPAAVVVGSSTDPAQDVTGGSVSRSVLDVAGNSSTSTVSGLNVDTVRPTLSGSTTTAPNSAGWFKGDVTIQWTASDARSGVDPVTVPGDSVISSEGTSLTASASVSDQAGNTRSATSTGVSIDRTAPVTGVSGPSNAWSNGTVTVNLSPVDALSGVASTTYAVDGGAPQTGTSFSLATEGDHTVTYFSTDQAGNAEAARTAHVKIDKTAPTITHSFAPLSYDGGWTNAAKVTVTFVCSDDASGVASCTPSAELAAEGGNQHVHGVATDQAGNSASDDATVNIDRTPPTISAAADRAANGNGWYDGDVRVSFACADQAGLSGIGVCAATKVLGEGEHQSADGTATDNAGNSATASLTGIDVDKTPPSLSGAATTQPNSKGWYDNSVVVQWSCSDALSGIDGSCPADSTVSGEGSDLQATETVSDRAGNSRTASAPGIRIDTIPPVTIASVSDPLATGWYADKAHVALTGHDNLSGLDRTFYSVDAGPAQAYAGAFDFSTPGVHSITFWSRDEAGNLEDATGSGHVLTLRIDGIPPTITGSHEPAPNAAGWNNTDVTVSFDCSDAESGVAGCEGGTTLKSDGANQYVTGLATDHGGNSSTAMVGPVNVDRTPPVLTGAATTSPNQNGWYKGDVTVRWTATDATSGVDEGTVPADTTVGGEGEDLTAGPVSVQDVAGNVASNQVAHLKIDRTAPVVTGTPTTSPNAAGWYRDEVSVAWTCSDAGSGVPAVDCPGNSTVSGEGDDLSTTGAATDRAGNQGTGIVAGLQIDRTAPTTAISAPSGWTNTDATVSLSATDNLSGVAAIHYTVDGGAVQTGDEIVLSAEGVYDLDVWSVDTAGNAEPHQAAIVRIDKSAPTITHVQEPAANDNGWNNTDVRIVFSCNDTGGSGVKECTDAITETHEGRNQPEPGTAVDNAGNVTTDPATVSIDKSAPTIDATADRPANDNGWYRAGVSVTYTCADQVGLSGIADCSSPTTIGEGAAQSASGTAVDAAGNHASTTLSGIDVDETPPTLHGAATTEPNDAHWYNHDVSVAWTCADVLSGIDGSCPADSTVTGEAQDLGASTQVADLAGNVTTATVGGIAIDRTAPVTSAVLPPVDSDNGWYRSGPTVSLVATDTLSGTASTFYAVDEGAAQRYTGPFTVGAEGVHSLTFWSTDRADNSEDRTGAGNTVVVRVDTTAPSINGSRLPAPNAQGWNNEPVLATFTCSDSGGSGVDTCTAPVTVSGQAAGQSATGTATDKVGNTSTTSVGGINIDLTNPVLSGAATTAPNADGWYRSDVSVSWTCSDALSGILGASCPATTVLSGEGDNLSAWQSATDNAGNTTAAAVDGLRIDRHAPITTVSAPSDWQRTGVALDVQATDNLSGVKATYFTINGGAPQKGNKIELSADGTYALTFWSIDRADNEGTHGSTTVKVDQTAPSISHTVTPEPNEDLWNNTDATVHFLCDDGTSGVQSCTDDHVVTAEAANQKVTGTAVDQAGNSATDTATLNVDKTRPTIAGAADRSPNANGWYDQAVTVSFTCADNLSGVADCGKEVILAEGHEQSASGAASDKAGNDAATSVDGINVDTTTPSLSGAVTSPNSGGSFHNGDVKVHWSCADALSGIEGSCPADSVVSGEGLNLTAIAAVTDKAGNTRTTTVGGISIDRTAPATALSAPDPTYPSGWYAAPVTVTLSASDNLSGVERTLYTIDGGAAKTYDAPFVVGKGVHTVSFWSADVAGNVEDSSTGHRMTFKVDNLAPSIDGAATTTPNRNGWYAGPVSVHFVCSDAQTQVASCPADRILSTEGAAQYITGTATDVAGNSATVKVGPISIDLTQPTFAPYTGRTAFTVGQTMTPPSCSATDSLSGLAGCTLVRSGSGLGNANGVGDFVYSFTATDQAGNTATQSVTLHVGYDWSGFLQPVTNTAHDLGTASTFKAGSTVPMKFQLKDSSGAVRPATSMPVWLQPTDLGTTSAGTGVVTGGTGMVGGSFKWDASAQQYVFTWQTPKSAAGHYFRVGVQLDSGDVSSTLIKLS